MLHGGSGDLRSNGRAPAKNSLYWSQQRWGQACNELLLRGEGYHWLAVDAVHCVVYDAD